MEKLELKNCCANSLLLIIIIYNNSIYNNHYITIGIFVIMFFAISNMEKICKKIHSNKFQYTVIIYNILYYNIIRIRRLVLLNF